MFKTKYIIGSINTLPYLDFDLSYGNLNLIGQDIVFVGSRRSDSIYVSEGMKIDCSQSGFGADYVYLTGSYSDYTKTINDQILTFSRTTAKGVERVSVASVSSGSSEDVIVFRDGSLGAMAVTLAMQNSVIAPTLDVARVSTNPVIPSIGSVDVKAIAQNNSLVATGFGAGVNLVVVGGRGIDIVYVKDGSNVDASQLGFSQDSIYLRGKWQDYNKIVGGQTLTLTRTVGSVEERVVVAATSGAGSDQLVFFDGAVLSNVARSAYINNPSIALQDISGYNPILKTPGVDVTPPHHCNWRYLE